ncbi:MAG: PAS domain S-box protein [Thermoanaerobaculia bacterium]|nr:PAS domain S-box protein [Thermoanaerobaculia bacterium]
MWRGGAPPAAVFANIAAPMQAEEAMSQSESFVRSTLDSLDSHIAVVGESGEILSVNEAWRRFCAANGGDAGSACGVGVNYLHVCEVAAADGCGAAGEFAEGLRAVLARQSPGFALEYECHSPEVRRWFVARVTPAGQGPLRAVIAHENITHRVLAEEALVAERSRLRTVLDTIPDLVWMKDPAGVFLACNDAFARMMDSSVEEILGRCDADFFPAEVAEAFRHNDLRAIELGGPWVSEEWIEPKNVPKSACFETIKTPVRDPGGKLLGVLGIARDVTQARAVAESLRQSEEHYRALAETTFDWIWEVDAAARYTFVSPRVVQLLGYEPDEVLGRTPFALMPEEEAARVGELFWSYATRQAPFANLENVNLHKDGRLVVLESSGVPFFGPTGDLRGYRGMDRDITARKQAERRSAMQAEVSRVLAASSSLAEAARGLLQAIGEPEKWSFGALWECGQGDSTLACVDWWAAPGVDAAALGAATRRLRLRRGEGFPGEIWAEARPRWIADLPADKDCRRQAEAAALHLRGAVGFPIRLGEELLGVIDFLGMSMSEPDPALQEAFESVGRQIGLFVDRRRGETALRRFVSGSPAVIYALRIEAEGQRLVWYSDNIEAMTGWESIPGDGARWWAENVHPEDQSAIQASFALPYEHDHLVLEFRFRRRDGRFLWVRDERRLLRDADGRPTEIVGSWTDVTERVELEEKLRVAQKLEAIGRLAGGVAHDFNNMLTVIGGNGEMLDRALAPGATERLLLGEIREAAARAATLTRQLLAFSRTQVLAPQVVGLDAVVGGVESMLRRLIGEDIALTCELGPETGHVLVDPGQLEQVIVNLVVNARDAMPQGGTLTLRTDAVELDAGACRSRPGLAPGRFARLTVRDSGTGMSAEIRERIFEPFFTTKPVGTGTGLGLSTVFGIVQQSGGHIGVESVEGQGTSFEICLPQLPAPAEGAVRAPAAAAAPSGKETVLLVEDEAGVRRVARLALERQGYTVHVAASGREALGIAEQQGDAIDLLLTDLVMPEMSGRELADILRARRPGLAVLLMSGYVEDDFVRHGVVTDEVAFLHKPFSLDELARAVRKVLDEARAPGGPGRS